MSHSTSVFIPVELEQFVNDQVATGAYANAEQVVRDALERLREREKSREARIEELRREVQVGLEQADRGECAPLDVDAIKRKARDTWDKQQASQ